MEKNTIFTEIKNKPDFYNILEKNKGILIFKFGAKWCKPCKKIKDHVDNFFLQTPSNITCFDIDIDNCDEVYSFLKQKRMVSGIPTLLCYKKNNIEYCPDDSFSGTNLLELTKFFKRCIIYSNEIDTSLKK